MSTIKKYIFSFLTLLFCFSFCFVSYGTDGKRRFKRRAPSIPENTPVESLVTKQPVTKNEPLRVAQNKSVALESPVVSESEEEITKLFETNSKRPKRGVKRNNNLTQDLNQQDSDQQPEEKPKIEELSVKEELPAEKVAAPEELPSENGIPQVLKDLDKRKPKEEEENGEKKEVKPEDNGTIEFYFENTDLQNVVAQVAQLYDVTFITDDVVEPIAQGGKALKGNKLSFKTHRPLTKDEGWILFNTFLNIAGFTIVPDANPRTHRIITVDKAQKAAIPSYIGVDPSKIPDTDQFIRYVYFVENINPETLANILRPMMGTNASVLALRELKALILTDRAYNIKTLMKIVKELDKVSMPQAMSVLKLTRADAQDVKKLYETLTKVDDQTVMTRLFPRKSPTSLYFPESIRIIAEPRTNSLILLGPRDAIEKIEDFVTKYVDIELGKPYSALYTYQLQFADAVTIENVMNAVAKFGAETAAGKVGGVRGTDKYFKQMLFIAEPSTNQIIIRGEYDDYVKAVEILKQLDEPQPQIAIEILLLTINVDEIKEWGSQIRSKESGICCGFGQNANFQTGNFGRGLATRDTTEDPLGCHRLLGNILNIVKGIAAPNTVVSLGCDVFGVWGVFKAIESISTTEVVSNPFLVATNKTKANVSIGEVRRLRTATIVGSGDPVTSYGDEEAVLDVTVTPQINSDGIIVLDILIDIKQFIPGTTAVTAARSIRKIDTKTMVSDKEVIALGGLIRNRTDDITNQTPLLGEIPILGWLFKDRRKQATNSNLLALVSASIVEPGTQAELNRFTKKHVDDYYGTLDETNAMGQNKDPVTRSFFNTKGVTQKVENLLFPEVKKQREQVIRKKKQEKRSRWRRHMREQQSGRSIIQNKTSKQNEIAKPVESKPMKRSKDQCPCKGNDQLVATDRKRKFSLTDFTDEDGETSA